MDGGRGPRHDRHFGRKNNSGKELDPTETQRNSRTTARPSVIELRPQLLLVTMTGVTIGQISYRTSLIIIALHGSGPPVLRRTAVDSVSLEFVVIGLLITVVYGTCTPRLSYTHALFSPLPCSFSSFTANMGDLSYDWLW